MSFRSYKITLTPVGLPPNDLIAGEFERTGFLKPLNDDPSIVIADELVKELLRDLVPADRQDTHFEVDIWHTVAIALNDQATRLGIIFEAHWSPESRKLSIWPVEAEDSASSWLKGQILEGGPDSFGSIIHLGQSFITIIVELW